MKEIIKILQAYKAGKITEKELTILLDIKKRGLFVIVENSGPAAFKFGIKTPAY